MITLSTIIVAAVLPTQRVSGPNGIGKLQSIETVFSAFSDDVNLRSPIQEARLSEDGRYLALHSGIHTLSVWDLKSDRQAFRDNSWLLVHSWKPIRAGFYGEKQWGFLPKTEKFVSSQLRTRTILSVRSPDHIVLLDETGQFRSVGRGIYFLIDYLTVVRRANPSPTLPLPSWNYVPLRSAVDEGGDTWLLLAGYTGRDYVGDFARKRARCRFECYQVSGGELRSASLLDNGNPFRKLQNWDTFSRQGSGDTLLMDVDLKRGSLFYVGGTMRSSGRYKDPIYEVRLRDKKSTAIPLPNTYEHVRPVFTDGRLLLNAYRKIFWQPSVNPPLLNWELLEWNFKTKKWETLGPYHVIATSGSRKVFLLEHMDGKMFLAWPKPAQ